MTKHAVVDTLTRLAAGRGALSAQELRQMVPVEAMRVEDIAALVAELEDRGVTVEIDPDLLVPRHPLSRGARAAAAVRPRSEAPPPAPPARPVGETSGSAAASSVPAPARTARPPSPGAVAVAVLAAAVVVVVLATLVWAF
jgi:hypothetical protein